MESNLSVISVIGQHNAAGKGQTNSHRHFARHSQRAAVRQHLV